MRILPSRICSVWSMFPSRLSPRLTQVSNPPQLKWVQCVRAGASGHSKESLSSTRSCASPRQLGCNRIQNGLYSRSMEGPRVHAAGPSALCFRRHACPCSCYEMGMCGSSQRARFQKVQRWLCNWFSSCLGHAMPPCSCGSSPRHPQPQQCTKSLRNSFQVQRTNR